MLSIISRLLSSFSPRPAGASRPVGHDPLSTARAHTTLRRARDSWVPVFGRRLSPAAAVDPIDAIATHPFGAPARGPSYRQSLGKALTMGGGMLTLVGSFASGISTQAGGPLIAVGMGAWLAAGLASPPAAAGRLGRIGLGLKIGAGTLGVLGGAVLTCPGPLPLAGGALLGLAAVSALASFVFLALAHRDGGLRQALTWAAGDLTGLPSINRRQRPAASLPDL